MTARSDGWAKLFRSEIDTVTKAVSPASALVYVSLASMRNSLTMRTPPVGHRLIQERTGFARRTVFASIAALCKAGFLEKQPAGSLSIFGFPLLDSASTCTEIVRPHAQGKGTKKRGEEL